MKDFYDIVVLARDFDFDGATVTRALRATFERRATPLPNSPPVALTVTFADDPTKKTQWSGFVRKAGIHDASTDAISGEYRPLSASVVRHKRMGGLLNFYQREAA